MVAFLQMDTLNYRVMFKERLIGVLFNELGDRNRDLQVIL